MKATKFIYFISIGLIMFALGCEPEYTEVGTVAKPDATKVDFTITTVDDFTVTVTSTSSIDGIFQWDLGNGKKATDTEVTTKYQMPATYNITLTVFTKGGSASVTKQFVQTKTDWTIFNDPLFIALSGGLEDADGKTWMLDKETKGHLGVGAGDNDEPGWWSADPMAKDGHQIYDDEYTFILQGLQYKIDTHGYTRRSYLRSPTWNLWNSS